MLLEKEIDLFAVSQIASIWDAASVCLVKITGLVDARVSQRSQRVWIRRFY